MSGPAMRDDLASSFVMVLPPGWVRLPSREQDHLALRAKIEEIVAEVLPASLPRDSAEPWRGELRKRLSGVVLDAEEAGASAVYLPISQVDGVVIPASFVESEVDDGGEVDPVEVLAAILGETLTLDGWRTIDGSPAARTDHVSTRVQHKGDWPEVTTRQVVYTIAVPHQRGRWVVLSFSAVSGDNPSVALSDALVYLFDALMTTFRWVNVPGVAPRALEQRLQEIWAAANSNEASP